MREKLPSTRWQVLIDSSWLKFSFGKDEKIEGPLKTTFTQFSVPFVGISRTKVERVC